MLVLLECTGALSLAAGMLHPGLDRGLLVRGEREGLDRAMGLLAQPPCELCRPPMRHLFSPCRRQPVRWLQVFFSSAPRLDTLVVAARLREVLLRADLVLGFGSVFAPTYDFRMCSLVPHFQEVREENLGL